MSQGCAALSRVPAGHCPACGYLVDPGACPECGVWVARPQSRPPRWRRRRRLLRGAIACSFALLLAAQRYSLPLLAREYLPVGLLVRWSEQPGRLQTWASDALNFRLEQAEKREQTAHVERDERIQAEATALIDHPWAGEYVIAGCEYNETLRVAPRSGFSYRAFDSGDLSYSNHGAIEETPRGTLRVRPVIDPRLPHPLRLSVEYVPVQWGGARLLIAEDEMPEFCCFARRGPTAAAVVGRLVRNGEEASGDRPAVPPCFEPFLDPPELRLRVVAFVARRLDAAGLRHELVFTFDAGAERGLLPRMHIFGNGDRWRELELATVTSQRSTATMEYEHDTGEPCMPSPIGWSYQTWAPEEPDEPAAD